MTNQTEKTDPIRSATNLAALCAALNAHTSTARALEAETGEQDHVDMTDLPTFGGDEPRDTSNTWSWDATHQVEQDLSGSGWKIVAREAR